METGKVFGETGKFRDALKSLDSVTRKINIVLKMRESECNLFVSELRTEVTNIINLLSICMRNVDTVKYIIYI